MASQQRTIQGGARDESLFAFSSKQSKFVCLQLTLKKALFLQVCNGNDDRGKRFTALWFSGIITENQNFPRIDLATLGRFQFKKKKKHVCSNEESVEIVLLKILLRSDYSHAAPYEMCKVCFRAFKSSPI